MFFAYLFLALGAMVTVAGFWVLITNMPQTRPGPPIRTPLFDSIVFALTNWAYSRKPNLTIGETENPYLYRWHLIPRNPLLNVYLHYFMRSDDDRALHDHPYASLSVLLWGSYAEHTIAAGGVHHRRHLTRGQMKFRRATDAHRVELINGAHCWSLFITGPRVRGWGFHCPTAGWVPEAEFVAFDADGASVVGRGCGEH